jgi:hypothetical protein
MKTFGERLREAIETHPMTVTTYSALTEISLPNLSHYLHGQRKPGLDTLALMLKHLPKADVKWLVTGERGVQS